LIPAVLWFVFIINISERVRENQTDSDYNIRWHILAILILGLGGLLFICASFVGVYNVSLWEDKFEDPGREDEDDYDVVVEEHETAGIINAEAAPGEIDETGKSMKASTGQSSILNQGTPGLQNGNANQPDDDKKEEPAEGDKAE
jgi:hypothetical protein